MLQDATNLGESCNSIVDHRAYKYKAVERRSCKPRGDPASGPPARNGSNNRSTKTTPPRKNMKPLHLYRVFHHHKALFDLGQTSTSNFIEGNASWEMRKAFAMQVLITRMNVWDLGILDAS